jgi:hypothetical protein
MNTIVDFPGEYLTPEGREKDRWQCVAFGAACVSGWPRDEQIRVLRTLLTKLVDAPNEQPSRQH